MKVYVEPAIDMLQDGKGMVELHWPSPAMPMETFPRVVYLYGIFFGLSFLIVLEFLKGRTRLAGRRIETVLSY